MRLELLARCSDLSDEELNRVLLASLDWYETTQRTNSRNWELQEETRRHSEREANKAHAVSLALRNYS